MLRVLTAIGSIAVLAGFCIGATGAAAQQTAVYAPFQQLIGDLGRRNPGRGAARSLPLQVGPRTFLYLVLDQHPGFGGGEEPRFEGMLVWNGAEQALDVLLVLDLQGGRIQEKGKMTIEADGTLVRRITASYSEGARMPDGTVAGPSGGTAEFRQILKRTGPDTMLTTLERDSGGQWVATFPGSQNLVMRRRKG